MIITRSPLRITLGGGGTDLPSYYNEHGGFCAAAAIDKYVYIAINQNFTQKLIVKYSESEIVERASDLKHPIIRECFRLVGIDGHGLEISAFADIPAGTGLGSSSAFTCALLKALYSLEGIILNSNTLAEKACYIEMIRLDQPIGKQDQFISAYGGINEMKFSRSGVEISELVISNNTKMDLNENLLLFFTGYSREASSILKDQNDKSISTDSTMLRNLRLTKEMGMRSSEALKFGDTKSFGRLMHEHWLNKKERSNGMTNENINTLYEIGINNGIYGGKLIGAGGGGFLMFYTRRPQDLKREMAALKIKEVPFTFDYEGTKIL